MMTLCQTIAVRYDKSEKKLADVLSPNSGGTYLVRCDLHVRLFTETGIYGTHTKPVIYHNSLL